MLVPTEVAMKYSRVTALAVLSLIPACATTPEAQRIELAGVSVWTCGAPNVAVIRLVGYVKGAMFVEVPFGPSVMGRMVKDSPFDAQVRFCSDEGRCQSTDTKVYIESFRKNHGIGRFTLAGRFAATFADGWEVDVHFITHEPPGKVEDRLCE